MLRSPLAWWALSVFGVPAAADAAAHGADALALLQGAVQREPALLKHTLRCSRGASPPGAIEYSVGGSQPPLKGKGVGYHFSKSLQDRDIRTLAHWGSVVSGVDQGDGWLLVGECYLPMTLDGKQVITPVSKPATPQAAQPAVRSAAAVVAKVPAAQAPAQQAAPAAAAALFVAGDAIEMYSKKAGRWFAAMVAGDKDALPGSYHIRLPMAKSVIPSVPVGFLRKPPVSQEVFTPGEIAEYRTDQAAAWEPCRVEGAGRLPGTYQLRAAGKSFALAGTWMRHRAPPQAQRPAAAAARPATTPLPRDTDIPTALRRLHSSYAEIKELLDAEESAGS